MAASRGLQLQHGVGSASNVGVLTLWSGGMYPGGQGTGSLATVALAGYNWVWLWFVDREASLQAVRCSHQVHILWVGLVLAFY